MELVNQFETNPIDAPMYLQLTLSTHGHSSLYLLRKNLGEQFGLGSILWEHLDQAALGPGSIWTGEHLDRGAFGLESIWFWGAFGRRAFDREHLDLDWTLFYLTK